LCGGIKVYTLSSIIMFTNPFSFSGRIRRTEYNLSLVICSIAALFVYIHADTQQIYMVLYPLIIWFFAASGAKRCHDINFSGFYQLIPLVGIYIIFAEGSKGKNDFGPDPVFNFNNDQLKQKIKMNLGENKTV
jgi:uncharacterized membrane protein YhaH (DUF805 family)